MENLSVSKISFGSTLHVSRVAYAKAIAKKLGLSSVDAPWSIYDAKYFKNGYSEEASYCTMGVIKNEFGDGFMFHLRPGLSSLKNIFENLFKAKIRLKYNNDLTGILVGGSVSNKSSKEQYQALQSMFKELNIKYSALLGQNDIEPKFNVLPYCNLYYEGVNDKYIICPIFNEFSQSKIKGINSLYKNFDTVIIRQGDTLKFD